MCFARIMQIIKRRFNSPYLYVAFAFIIYISVYMILGVIRNKYTPINGKNDENNNKWIFNFNYKKKREIVPTKSFEDLNTFHIRMPVTVILLTITSVVLLLFIYYLCRKYYKTVFPTDRDPPTRDIEDPDIDDANLAGVNAVHFQNNRVVLGSRRESSSDEEV